MNHSHFKHLCSQKHSKMLLRGFLGIADFVDKDWMCRFWSKRIVLEIYIRHIPDVHKDGFATVASQLLYIYWSIWVVVLTVLLPLWKLLLHQKGIFFLKLR